MSQERDREAGPTDEELMELAVLVAEEAGSLVMRHFRRARPEIATKTSPTDFVSGIDRASEELIVERLRGYRGHDGIVAEEEHVVPTRSGITWVIDPLDGSTNYIYGLAPFGVSIAACRSRGGGAVVPCGAAVYDPLHGEMFKAGRGLGATLNGQKLLRRRESDLSVALVGTGFSHSALGRAREAALLTRILPAVGDIRRSGSAAVDLCWLAAGRLDAFYHLGLKVWDYAGASLVVRESGGWEGHCPEDDDGNATVVAAAPGVEDALVRLLDESGLGCLARPGAGDTLFLGGHGGG